MTANAGQTTLYKYTSCGKHSVRPRKCPPAQTTTHTNAHTHTHIHTVIVFACRLWLRKNTRRHCFPPAQPSFSHTVSFMLAVRPFSVEPEFHSMFVQFCRPFRRSAHRISPCRASAHTRRPGRRRRFPGVHASVFRARVCVSVCFSLQVQSSPRRYVFSNNIGMGGRCCDGCMRTGG